MHSHEIHALERVKSLRDKCSALQAKEELLTQKVSSLRSTVAAQSQQIEVYTKVGQLFRHLTDSMVLDQVKALEVIITEGLQSVFFDQTLSFKATLGESNSKVSVDFTLESEGRADDLIEGSGGGPASVVSLLLRLLMLLRLKKFPLLVLDETLLAVSGSYVETTGALLRKLANTSNLPILMVTHNASFLEVSDQALEGCLVAAEGGRRNSYRTMYE